MSTTTPTGLQGGLADRAAAAVGAHDRGLRWSGRWLDFDPLPHTFLGARRRTPQCAVLLSFLFLPSFLFINHGHRMLIRVSNPIGMPDSRLLAWALIPVSRPQGRRRPDVAEYRLRHGRRGGAG